MRFDVPVVGLPTIEQMKSAHATAMAIDAGRTLLFDREKLIAEADAAGIAIQAVPFAAATPSVNSNVGSGETSAGQATAELGTVSGGMKKQ
jgi:hypothetical protein